MLLTNAHVKMFKSIEDSNNVPIDPSISILVGQNESGKTAFLQALHKAYPFDKSIAYNLVEDYPRRALNDYERQYGQEPAVVTELTYLLDNQEIKEINEAFGFQLLDNLSFTHLHTYSGSRSILMNIPEEPYIQYTLENAKLPQEINEQASKAKTIRELISILEDQDLNSEATSFLDTLKRQFYFNATSWDNLLEYVVWKNHIAPQVPKFLYFDDYYLLPGKINLPLLQQHVAQGQQALESEDKTVLSLLSMAGIELSSILNTTGYEESRAKLEGVSNAITDKVFKYWTQNQNLEVLFDIRQDPQDQAPFNNGNNLYIRIRNTRHRVSVPFNLRSKGFIWFFSFMVWFDSIKQQLNSGDSLILLLDEPGLSLHALAQADFLGYIDVLAKEHQILYTTHSPFMVHSDRLHQVRTVEDHIRTGTKISDNVSGSSPNTLFPLQAALGYTIAQNLFISKRNLLVEGPADLIYLRFFSSLLDQIGRKSLRDDVTIVPVGGLDNLATFVALLRGNELELTVLHDYESKPEQRLDALVRESLIRDKQILNYAMFRTSGNPHLKSSDVEDMISVDLYLKLFNNAYKKELGSREILQGDLPPGDRVVERIGQYLKTTATKLRASGGYNHYRVANYLASNPLKPEEIDSDTLDRFEQLFEKVNQLYSVVKEQKTSVF